MEHNSQTKTRRKQTVDWRRRAASFGARSFHSSIKDLRKEAQAINERDRVPGDPHYKEPQQPMNKAEQEEIDTGIYCGDEECSVK